MPRRARWWLLAAVVVGTAACGDVGGPGAGGDTDEPVIDLTVVNESQFVLLELRVHDTESYSRASNKLSKPLLEKEEHYLEPFERDTFVTVFHEKNRFGGKVAVTTAERIEVRRRGHRLLVFDDSFRLMDP